MDRGEPIDLAHTFGRVQRWRRGRAGTWEEERIEVGELADGRWCAARRGEARAYPTEAQARQVARQLMDVAGDGWVDEPYPPAPTLRPPVV